MKLDLWRCDRCGSKREQPAALGNPTGWAIVTITRAGGGSAQEKHFCESCSVTFAGWARGPEHTVPMKCPNCAANLLVIHGIGDPYLKFVPHNV